MKNEPLIIDASVVASWFLDDEDPAALSLIDKLDSYTLIVPPLWIFEVSNTLLLAERRKRSVPAQTMRWLDIIEGLDWTIDVEMTAASCKELLAISREQNISAYDAVYLALAMRTNAKLATLDRAMRKAAKSAGVRLMLEN